MTTKELERPTWPETWMEFAKTIAIRSYDPKLKVGAVIVSADNTTVLSLGYNGNAHGLPNERESQEVGKSGFIHAEQNAYYKLDFHNPKERVMYVLFSPCSVCAKGAIQCRINRVVYDKPYMSDTSGIEIMKASGIEVFSLAEAVYLAKKDVWKLTGDEGIRRRISASREAFILEDKQLKLQEQIRCWKAKNPDLHNELLNEADQIRKNLPEFLNSSGE